jgi:hypothetical protein
VITLISKELDKTGTVILRRSSCAYEATDPSDNVMRQKRDEEEHREVKGDNNRTATITTSGRIRL